MEEENKAKNDANRQKKTVEDRCYELEGNLESAQKVYIQYTKFFEEFYCLFRVLVMLQRV